MLRLMGKKIRYKRFKKQTGGSALDSVFSNFKMDDFMKGLSDAFAGFSGNPQLQGIFDNSNKLFNNFQSQVNLPSEQVNGLKPLFDLFSMFTKKYEDGGEVEMEDEPSQIESVEDLLKQVFNQQYADRSAPAEDLIPGLVHTPPVMKKGGNPDKVGNKIKKLIDEGYPQKQAIAIALDMQKRHKLQMGGNPTPSIYSMGPNPMMPTPNDLDLARTSQFYRGYVNDIPNFSPETLQAEKQFLENYILQNRGEAIGIERMIGTNPFDPVTTDFHAPINEDVRARAVKNLQDKYGTNDLKQIEKKIGSKKLQEEYDKYIYIRSQVRRRDFYAQSLVKLQKINEALGQPNKFQFGGPSFIIPSMLNKKEEVTNNSLDSGVANLKDYIASKEYLDRLYYQGRTESGAKEEQKRRLNNINTVSLSEIDKLQNAYGDYNPKSHEIRIAQEKTPSEKHLTSIHEYAHSSTIGNKGFNDFEDHAFRKSIITPFDYALKMGGDENMMNYLSQGNYYTKNTEIHARLNELRALAKETGIHKKFGQDFTQDELNLLYSNLIKKKDPIYTKAYNELYDVLKGSGPDEKNQNLLYLLNKVAINDNNVSPKIAQLGGGVGGKFQSGGTPMDSILLANQTVPFVNKIMSGDTTSVQIPGEPFRSTHFMASSDNIAYPTVQIVNGKLTYIKDGKKAYENAIKTGNYIKFKTAKEAENFAMNYKNSDIWKQYEMKGKYQSGGIPVTPNGQFDFPGMPTMVPTPNGSITMNGVNQPLLAIDQMGQMAILPPNSGEHQFSPGMVLEIPMDNKKPTKKKSSKPKEDYGMNFMKRTLKRFNDRNKRMTRIARTGDVGMPFGKRR